MKTEKYIFATCRRAYSNRKKTP